MDITEQIPFETPKNWVWTRLSHIANIYTGNSISETEKKSKFTDVIGRYYIGTKDVDFNNRIIYDNGIAIPKQYEPDFRLAPNNSILMCIEGGSAGKKNRMQEGFCCGMVLEFIYGIFIFLVCFIFAKPLMCLFVQDEEVIMHGVTYLHLISIMYILPAFTNGIQGFFSGIGDLKITLISRLVNMTVRVIVAAPLVFSLHLGIEALPYSYLAGWIGMLMAELPLLIRTYKAYE